MGNNMFAYCNNCAPNLSDSSGNRPVSELERFGEVSLPVPSRPKVKYNVPLYEQGNRNLCWAFSQQMLQSYYDGIQLSQEQAAAAAAWCAVERNGILNWNSGGWPQNMGNQVDIQNIHSLYEVLRTNGPIYALYSNNATKKADKLMHLVVVTGVNLTTNTVYTNNPWGRKGVQSFQDFLANVAWDYPNALDMTFSGAFLAK